jgi:hypothetical protein
LGQLQTWSKEYTLSHFCLSVPDEVDSAVEPDSQRDSGEYPGAQTAGGDDRPQPGKSYVISSLLGDERGFKLQEYLKLGTSGRAWKNAVKLSVLHISRYFHRSNLSIGFFLADFWVLR